MTTNKPSQEKTLPQGILAFIASFMRAINTARLYASGHDLFKKNIQELYPKLDEGIADGDFLFLGCAKDAVFIEGAFYPAEDAHLKKFLEFFNSLRIAYLLLDKETSIEELQSFIVLVAGAGQGQGEEISAALPRERIKHIKLGLLSYSIFSTVRMVASQLAKGSEDEAVWRQLILLPAGAGAFNLDPEKIKQLERLAEDAEELNKLLLEMDRDMREKEKAVSLSQRAMILGNFLQNLGDTLAGIDPEKRGPFAYQVGRVLEALEPRLKTQILGSVSPADAGEKEGGVIHEIFRAMADDRVVHLLADALKEKGGNSACFINLFNRALARYEEPCLLLVLIRQEMNKAAQEKQPGKLNHLQHLEQLLLQKVEADEMDEQYRKEMEALATSIRLEAPVVEEEERVRLLNTLTPEFLTPAKARLIVDLIRQPHPTRATVFFPPLLESLGTVIGHFLSQGNYRAVGNLLTAASLILRDFSQESSIRKAMGGLLDTKQVKELMENLLKNCRTWQPKETAVVDAICQIFPEKAAGFLIDILLETESDDSPKSRWLSTTLAGMGPKLIRSLSRQFQNPPDHALSRLLDLASISGDRHLAGALEPLLEHKDQEIRLKVIGTLGDLRADRSVPSLAEIVLQKGWLKGKKMKSAQMAAARALAEIGTEKAKAVLRQVAEDGSDELKTLCQELV